jgi:hypothetical protein
VAEVQVRDDRQVRPTELARDDAHDQLVEPALSSSE